MSGKVYTVQEAAKFLDMSVRNVRNHLYGNPGDLKPDGYRGTRPVFKLSTLVSFQENRTKPGRPKVKKTDDATEKT